MPRNSPDRVSSIALRVSWLVLLLLATSAATAQPWRAPDAAERQVLRVYYQEPAQLQRIAARYGHLVVDPERQLILLEADAFARYTLQREGLRVEVETEATRAVNAERPIGRDAKAIGGLTCYRTVEETYASIDALAASHPQLASVTDIGPSWRLSQGLSGYPLRVLKLTNAARPGPKPKFFVMASVHAREYTPAETVTRFAEQLVAGYGRDADATWMLDHLEVHALLQANPDGRKLAEAQWNSTVSGQRKNANFNFCSGGRLGVDLNRNYPFSWNSAAGGSSGDPCADTYRGPFATSEPETNAVVSYVRSQFADARGPGPNDPAPDTTPGLFFDIHSFSRLVLWPWGNINQPAPNGAALQTLGRRLAWTNNYTPQQATGLYLTDGTTIDFAYGDLGIAAFTLELGNAFFESCGAFENTIAPDNLRTLRYALRSTRRPYLEPAGPESYAVAVSPDLVVRGSPATLTATIDDRRFSTSSAPPNPVIQPQHPIIGADAFIGTPPWLAGAMALPLGASDGSFDTPLENISGTLPTAGLAAGRHLVWVQGRDANADTARASGPVSAAFLRVVEAGDLATLSGRVTALEQGAAVAATLAIDDLRATSDAQTGQYQRTLAPGSYALEISAPGFESQRIEPLNVPAGAALTRDIALLRFCARLQESGDVGASSAFTAQTPWQRLLVTGANGGAWIAGTGINYGANLNASLSSNAINLGADSRVILRFRQRCATQARFDFGIVEVRAAATDPWTEVSRCEGDPNWREVELALPQLAGAEAAQVRFRFTSDGSGSAAGFALDDIVLDATGTACREAQNTERLFNNGFEG